MKYNVSITKRLIITAIIFIVGLVFLLIGTRSYYKYSHALDLETLDEQMMKEGGYIIGSFNTYIDGATYENNQFYNVSQTHLTTWDTYDYYTVPVGEDSYVVLLISDEALKEQLNTYENGRGKTVHFEGIIIEPPTELNYDWYKNVENFNPENLIDSFVVKEATLIQRNATIWGIVLMLLSAFVFVISGGSKSVVSVETDKTDYDLYVNILDKKDNS